MLFLHGALARGRNWSQPASAFCERHRDWRALLVDLRCHGESVDRFQAPHSLDAAAEDVCHLMEVLHENRPSYCERGVDAIVGHSLGGKVLFHLLDQAMTVERAATLGLQPEQPLRCVAVDTSPGHLPVASDVHQVLAFVRERPLLQLGSPREIESAVMNAGMSRRLAQWLASSTRRIRPPAQARVIEGAVDGEDERPRAGARQLAWTFDADCVESLLDSYQHSDSWPLLLRGPPPWAQLSLVVGERSSRWSDPEVAPLLASLSSGVTPRVSVARVDAGHWVHVDRPNEMLDVLTQALVRPINRGKV